MRDSASLPTGVAAFFFESAQRHRHLEKRLVEHVVGRGFDEVVLPVVDFLEPYEALLDPASRGDLYQLVDQDGNILALRADFTPMLARLLAPRLPSLEMPLKLFYRGDVLRRRETRAGQNHEFFQLGAELLGLRGPEAENQALHVFLELLRLTGAPSPRVVLGFAGALDRLLIDAAGEADPAELAAAVARRERRAARTASPALLQVVENGVPDDAEILGRRAAQRLDRLGKLQAELDREFPEIEISVDLAEFAERVMLRELRERIGARAYYDGLVFKAFAGDSALSVGGGGRYDRLFRKLGADVTAAGFGFSLDRLLESLDEVGS